MDGEEISIFAMGTLLLRQRWRIVRWGILGGVLAAALVAFKPKTYSASASFIPQADSRQRSGLADLAGQFGVSLPTGSRSLSPDFYAELVQSRVLDATIVADTFTVAELGGKRVPFLELFRVPGASAEARREAGVSLLRRSVSANVESNTGVVTVSVSTPWRSVSLAIVAALIDGVHDFNDRVQQQEASAERKFVEGRLAVAGTELRNAEDQLEQFLQSNRQIDQSPELQFQRDRLQRAVGLRQQVYTSLMQEYEDARIREVRDTPGISLFEPPMAPTRAQARGRLKTTLLGALLGTFFGIVLAFTSRMMSRHREDGDPEAREFADAWAEAKGELLRPFARARKQQA